MYRLKIHRYNTFLFLTAAISGLLSVACVDDHDSAPALKSERTLTVSAVLSEPAKTRTYQASGIIETGTYFLTYRNLEAQYGIATVNFSGGTGTAIDKNNELIEWNDIGFDPSGAINDVTLYLDNISADKSDSEDATTVKFNDIYNPFKAGVFDSEEGKNDLLWGERFISRNTPIVNFQLHHNMARLNLELIYQKENEDAPLDELDIEHATVTISNLTLDPESYDRVTGELQLPEYQPGTVFTLVDQGSWLSKSDVEDGSTYISNDFVFPPQALEENENRPRLTVRVPVEGGEDRIFSGVIPRAMEVTQADGTTIPMNLSLMKEHILTLHIRLSPDPLQLVFMPVTVIDWVDEGTFMITANQAGIYNVNDFQRLIMAYKDQNTDELYKLGYKDRNNNWVFNIFCSLTLQYDDIFGKMPVNAEGDYSFYFHGWTVTVEREGQEPITITGSSYGDDDYEISQKFVEILTGK